MAKIHSSDLNQEIRDGAKIQALEKAPSELAEKVVPVLETNPKLLKEIHICKSAFVGNTLSTTIYTTPSNKDFFLVGFDIALSQDATSINSAARLTATLPSNEAVSMGRIVVNPGSILTSITSNQNFGNHPMKLARNSTINMVVSDVSAGNTRIGAVIYGYELDSSNA